MLRKKESKRNNIIIIFLSILLLVSLVFVFILGRYYFKDINEPQYGLTPPVINGGTCSTDEIHKSNISYVIDQKKLVEFDKKGEEFLDNYQGRKYIKYPVIVSGDVSTLDLNDKIKDKVDSYIETFNLGGDIIDGTVSKDDLCYIESLDNGTLKNYCSYLVLNYNVYENNEYFSIVEDEELIDEKNSEDGYKKLNDVYYVSKTSGEVVLNEDVLKNVNNLALMKNSLIKYIKENYLNLNLYKENEVIQNDFEEDLDALLSTNGFRIYFEKDSVYFYFSKIQGIQNVLFKYNDTEWVEVTDRY